MNGIYYATFDEVWDARGVPFNPSDYEALMIRDEYPSYTAAPDDDRWNSRFEISMECASQSIYDVALGMRQQNFHYDRLVNLTGMRRVGQ